MPTGRFLTMATKNYIEKKVLKSFDICIEVGLFFTETALQENDFFQKE